MIGSVTGAVAECKRAFICERIKSGIAVTKARGEERGRQSGQRRSDRQAEKVLTLVEAEVSYRMIGRRVGLSKNTVGAIVQRVCSRRPTVSRQPASASPMQNLNV
jgi:putative DNA-invertase from lambdoid prophage Rac